MLAAVLLTAPVFSGCAAGNGAGEAQTEFSPLMIITPGGSTEPTEYVPRTPSIVTVRPTATPEPTPEITERPDDKTPDRTDKPTAEPTREPTEKPTEKPSATPTVTAPATWDPSVYYQEEDDLPYARYYIEVALNAQIVYIYSTDVNGDKNQLVKTMICSSGREGKTPERYWIILDNDTQDAEITDTGFDSRYDFEWVKGCAVQYITRMWKAEWDDNGKLKVTSSSYLFHSTPYDTKDKNTLRAADWNKLGTAVSDGCIRLCVRDAHWIYEKVAPYSVVRTYGGEPDPETWNSLKLPDIPENMTKDPTDVY